MKNNQLIRLALGIGLTCFGIFWIFFPTMVLFHEVEAGFLGTLIILFVLGIIPMAQGLLLIRRVLVLDKEEKNIKIENRIFELAHQNFGKITPIKLAKNTNISVIEAKQYLSKLQEDGFADIEVTDNGVVYYDFKELLSEEGTAA